MDFKIIAMAVGIDEGMDFFVDADIDTKDISFETGMRILLESDFETEKPGSGGHGGPTRLIGKNFFKFLLDEKEFVGGQFLSMLGESVPRQMKIARLCYNDASHKNYM